jgi:hypothetical protein
VRIASLAVIAIICSSGALCQEAPKVAGKPLVQVKPKGPVGCTFVGRVKGTKVWAGDCAEADQLRGAAPDAEGSEPPLAERAAGAIPPGQK